MDCCLPMGCSISCSYFEIFSNFLEWVVKHTAQVDSVLHYLDDFLFVSPSGSRVCGLLLRATERVLANFGVPLAPDKRKNCIMGGLCCWRAQCLMPTWNYTQIERVLMVLGLSFKGSSARKSGHLLGGWWAIV